VRYERELGKGGSKERERAGRKGKGWSEERERGRRKGKGRERGQGRSEEERDEKGGNGSERAEEKGKGGAYSPKLFSSPSLSLSSLLAYSLSIPSRLLPT
jgi:hypothetical protein